jgi:hypothetical protein
VLVGCSQEGSGRENKEADRAGAIYSVRRDSHAGLLEHLKYASFENQAAAAGKILVDREDRRFGDWRLETKGFGGNAERVSKVGQGQRSTLTNCERLGSVENLRIAYLLPNYCEWVRRVCKVNGLSLR